MCVLSDVDKYIKIYSYWNAITCR